MSELAALQAEMAQALLAGRFEGLAGMIRPGPIAAEEALAVHRNTALHGLINALRLAHPTVDALVGEDFFDQAARDFVLANPPSSAWLTGYGAGFGDFLQGYWPVSGMPYLADVARFDFALEQVGEAAAGVDGRSLDLGEAALTLDASLRLARFGYPAAAIRDAIGDDQRLAGLDVRPCPEVLALWRLPDGVGVRALSPVSAAVLEAMLAGGDPGDVLPEAADLTALQSEVFAAPFARITIHPQRTL